MIDILFNSKTQNSFPIICTEKCLWLNELSQWTPSIKKIKNNNLNNNIIKKLYMDV